MAQRKAKTCTKHKDLKPATSKLQRSHHSYITDQEKIENEIGKGDVDWFSKASRQQHKQTSQHNSQQAVTPLAQKFNHDTKLDCSPIDHVPDLLESQFSTTSPLTAWIPPSLGRSPITVTAQQYGESQFDLVKSLGINDSTLSWTSSLATPNNDDIVQFKEKKTPVESKKRSFSRMLFSPGLNAEDISKLNSSCNRETDASSKKFPESEAYYNGQRSSKKTKTDAEYLSDNKQNIKANLFESCHTEGSKISKHLAEHTILDNTSIKVESKEPLEDALSDFFDPPSKAAGRRRSAPSYRRSLTKQDMTIPELSKSFNGCDSHKNNSLIKSSNNMKEDCIENNVNSTNKMTPSVISTMYGDDKIVKMYHFDDLKNPKDTNIKYETISSEELASIEKYVDVVTHEDIKETNDSGRNGDECSQIDLFCSTPIDVKRPYKSILSTSKKKTPMSKKRVRFNKEIENDVKKEQCENEMTLQGLKVESTLENNRITTSENFTPVKNKSELLEKDSKEGSKEIQEDLFSQVSPTVLEEMCSIGSDKSSQMSSCTSTEKSQTLTSENSISKSNPDEEKLKADLNVSCYINNNDTSKGNASEVEKSVSMEANSCKKINNNKLPKSSKVKRFFYPTNSQINKSCPKSVYGFKHEETVVQEQVTSNISTNTVMSESLSVTPTVPVDDANKSSTPLSIERTGWRDTGKSTTGSGFKRYSELVKEDNTDSTKTTCTVNKSTEYTSRSRQNSCSTPVSSKRNSTGLTAKRLCLKEYNYGVNNDNSQLTNEKQQKKEYIDTKDLHIPTASSDTHSIMKVKGQAKDKMQEKCQVEDTSFDELQDDSFAKEISMDGTLEKLSGCTSSSDSIRKVSPVLLRTSVNHQLSACSSIDNVRKVSPVLLKTSVSHQLSDCSSSSDSVRKVSQVLLGTSVNHQYKHNLKMLEKEKEVSAKLFENEKCDVELCQGFSTASGNNINIEKNNMTKAEKLMHSVTSDLCVEMWGDLVSDDDSLKIIPHSTATDDLEKRNGSSISPWGKNRAKMLDVEVEVGKNNSCWKNLEPNGKRNTANVEERSVGGYELLKDKKSKSDAASDFKGLNRETKPNSEYKKIIQSNGTHDPVTKGFTTASGKGLACSVSSLSKANILFTDIQDQMDADDSLVSGDKDLQLSVNESQFQDGLEKMTVLTDKKADQKLSTKNEIQEKEFDHTCKSTNLGGFSTASGKGISISTLNLSKAENFIREAENEAKKAENSLTESSLFGEQNDIHLFHLEKIENVQGTTDKVSRHIGSEIDTCSTGFTKFVNQGFSSASGKNITLSASSLAKAKNLIKDTDNMNTPMNKDIDKNFENGSEESTNFNGQCGFQTANGKNVKLSSSSLLKADSLMKDIEKNTDISCNGEKTKYLQSAGKEFGSFGGFSFASGKNLNISTTSLSKAQGLMNDFSSDVMEKNPSGSRKEQFESIFKDLTNQHSMLDTINKDHTEKSKLDAEKDDDLEKELESMLKTSTSKVSIIKPTKSSRFPPGANIPKGFRPFKPPKLISKPKTKDEPLKNKQNENLLINEERNKQTTTEQESTSYGNEQFDNSLLEDVFSDEMLPSQKFSPTSGRPIKKSIPSTNSDNDYKPVAMKSYEVDCQSYNAEKDVTAILGNQGDNKITYNTEIEHEIDFKGDNTQFSLEDIMNPENEFTQVLESNTEHCEDNDIGVQTIKSGQNIVMSQKIVNPFQSASGKTVCVSEKALLRARDTLNNENTNILNMNNDYLQSNSGNPFKSASGKSVKVSEKALNYARQTLNDDNFHSNAVNQFQSASGKDVHITEQALKFPRQTLENENFQVEHANPFQSASGKNVHVSENALKIARQTLEDENLQLDHINPFQSASGKSVHVSEKALQFAKKALNDDNFQSNSGNPFQSASGKDVHISEKALTFARQTLNDENLPVSTSNPFQSASGKEVHISDKALKFARQTLEDENANSPDHNQFQSASGKSVHMSEKAQKFARQTLKDDDLDDHNPFQSASGKQVHVSEKALQLARQTLNDENIPGHNLFQSASGKDVHISEKALQLARQTLNDDNIQNNNLFQSACGKDVHISEKALQLARQTLNEENLHGDLNTSKKSTLQNVKRLPDNKYVGGSNTENFNNDSIKRKRIEFEDDFDVPVEILEQMELYGKRQKMSKEEGRKKPLSTVPEDYRCDRQFSGFSPKPLKSQSAHQRRVISEYQCSGDQVVPPKSTFKTPYKPLAIPGEITLSSDSKMKVASPVFVQKTTVLSEDNHANQKFESFKKASPHKPPVRTFDNQQKSVNSRNKSEIKSNNNNYLPKNNSIGINKQTVQLIQKSRKEQEDKIKQKLKRKVVPVEGRLYEMKQTQRRLKLKDVISFDRNGCQKSIHVQPSTKKIRCSNSALHRFYMPEYYGMNIHHIIVGDGALLVPDDTGYAGKEEFYQAFLTIDSVDSKLVDEKWFFNHYRWVVWKLASYEVTSPEQFGGRCLTPEVVMLQMKYRYDREIDKCQRSAIMKICERDDTPCKRMVLCVSEIKHDGKETQVSLTDAWYSINGKVDSYMASLINRGCIQVGHKLCMSGSELIGSQNACPPLEAPESLMLKISTNSTRPAPWDTKLGYQTDHTPLCVPLSSLQGEGGIIGCIDVIVVRKYPTMYMEKLPAGGCVFRSYAAEEKYKQSFQQIQQERMENLYQQLENQYEKNNKEDKSVKRKKWSRKAIEQLSTGMEIYEAVNTATHADDVQSYLSDHQIELLMEHQRIVQDEKRQKLNGDFQKAWNDGEENHKERIVIPLMKIRIVGCCRKDMDSQFSTLLTIWRPTAAHTDLTEGKRYKVYSLTASSPRSKSQSGVQLTATKQTLFKPLPIDDNILDLVYENREVLIKQDLIQKKPPYGEADVVGIVIEINSTHSEYSGKQQDMVYIADINDDFIGIKFWGGVKYNGMSDTIQEGSVCYCCNLCDKSTYPSRNLPILEFTSELSVISQSPQNVTQRKYTDKLKAKLKNKSEYMNMVKGQLTEKLTGKNILTVSKCSPEKMNPNTVVGSNCQTPNRELPSNSQTPNLKSASKMAALLSYQSPSPLSPLVLSSTKSIHKAFKPPMLPRK